MTWGRALLRSWPRELSLALAMVALVLKIAAPPGFMLEASSQTPGGLAVVICTGHGALTAPDPAGKQTPADKAKADSPCAFAGAATPLAPALQTVLPSTSFEAIAPPTLARREQTPGRGLAAPPPPAIGPPRFS